MNMDEKINRINELYHKSQAEGLSTEEKEEQKNLRQDYIDSIRSSLKGQLDNVDIKEADGSITNLGEKYGEKKASCSEDTENIKNEKSLLRSRMIKKRDSILKDDRLSKSMIIKDTLFGIDEFNKAKTVLLYASYNSEVSTFAIMDECKKQGKHVAFPKCSLVDGVPNLTFYEVSKFSQLAGGYKGIPEPDTIKYNLKKISDKIDVVIVPGVCFDKNGNRLGYGKGFYDRFLKKYPNVYRIGIAFDEQICDDIPTEKTDLAVNMIVTDKQIIKI